MNYDIVLYGDSRLRKKAVPVESVDGTIRQLAKDMLKAMYESDGIGLAAQQVGRLESICVIDVTPTPGTESGRQTPSVENPGVTMPVVMVNPTITSMSGEQTEPEGCLSFPGIVVPVRRADRVTVTFTDLNNKEETVEARGLLALAVQHEVDHLNGVLLVDRMSPVQKVAIAGKLKRLRKMRQARAPVR